MTSPTAPASTRRYVSATGRTSCQRTRLAGRLEREHALARVESDPRFARAPYVGHKGWVTMDTATLRDWDEVRALILESYRLIAPKRTFAKLGTAPARPKATRPAGRRRRP